MNFFIKPIYNKSSQINDKKLLDNAKTVCNVVQGAFPYFSPTKFSCENRMQLLDDDNLRNSIVKIQDKIQNNRNKYIKLVDKPIDYYTTLIKGIEGIQAMNCGEAASLTYMCLKMNGICNCMLAAPVTLNNRRIDHTVVKVITGKAEDIIIDTWLGVAEYEGKMNKIYNTDYPDYFELIKGEKINFECLKSMPIDEFNINDLKEMVPQLYLHEVLNHRKVNPFALFGN